MGMAGRAGIAATLIPTQLSYPKLNNVNPTLTPALTHVSLAPTLTPALTETVTVIVFTYNSVLTELNRNPDTDLKNRNLIRP